MDTSIALALGLGFLQGLRHALEADHVIAVSTIVSEHKSISRSSLIGAWWGLGHTSTLLAVGILIILLRTSISQQAMKWMEMPVAAMLILLGINALRQAVKDRGLAIHTHSHSHDGSEHAHVHVHAGDEHSHLHKTIRIGKRPFLVGMVHGFAGSAALTLAVLTTIPSIALGVAYIVVFGIGSVGGMLLMSAMISVPFVLTARRFNSINSVIRVLAGLFSLCFGLMLAWELLSEIKGLHS